MTSIVRSATTTSFRSIARSNAIRASAVNCRSISTTRPIYIAPTTAKMSTIIGQAAQAAHSAFAALASYSEAKAGDSVPDVNVRINDLEDRVNFSKLQGKNILVTVPGAFSPTCTSQVPSYSEKYSEFQAKGVKDIYVVAVNDIFVMNAWKKSIRGEEGKDDGLKYVADDTAELASKLGLVFDAGAVFGGPRLKRGAVVIDNGKVVSVVVEPSPGEVTVSHANEVLKSL